MLMHNKILLNLVQVAYKSLTATLLKKKNFDNMTSTKMDMLIL